MTRKYVIRKDDSEAVTSVKETRLRKKRSLQHFRQYDLNSARAQLRQAQSNLRRAEERARIGDAEIARLEAAIDLLVDAEPTLDAFDLPDTPDIDHEEDEEGPL